MNNLYGGGAAAAGAGFTVSGLTGIVFIILKIAGLVDWSWLWVLSPFWISFALCLLILTVVLIGYGIKGHFENKRLR